MQHKISDPHMIHTHIHNKLVLKEKDPCILFTMFLMMVLNLNKLLHFFFFKFKMWGKKMLLSSDLSKTSADEQSAVWKGKKKYTKLN